MGYHGRPLLAGHPGELPVRIECVNVVKDQFSSVCVVDLHGFITWTDEPVFPDAAFYLMYIYCTPKTFAVI